MSDKPAYLTRDGRAKLEAELEVLQTNGRREVAERIGAAKERGDSSESGERRPASEQNSGRVQRTTGCGQRTTSIAQRAANSVR